MNSSIKNEQGNSFPKKLYENWPVWEDVDPFTSEKSIEDNLVAII
jgi:hypothetical protein